jgi:hypothetical protein
MRAYKAQGGYFVVESGILVSLDSLDFLDFVATLASF